MPPDDTPVRRAWISRAERRQRRIARGLAAETDARIEAQARRAARRGKAAWVEHRERISAIKLAAGCVDCGYNRHPAALDFDHLPGVPKRENISRLVHARWDAVLAEIEKCEVVCANCHRIRTLERRQGRSR